MMHTWKCKQCGEEWHTYCFQKFVTEEDERKTRAAQRADLCVPCFEIEETKKESRAHVAMEELEGLSQ